jgi:hypothetical protein
MMLPSISIIELIGSSLFVVIKEQIDVVEVAVEVAVVVAV